MRSLTAQTITKNVRFDDCIVEQEPGDDLEALKASSFESNRRNNILRLLLQRQQLTEERLVALCESLRGGGHLTAALDDDALSSSTDPLMPDLQQKKNILF